MRDDGQSFGCRAGLAVVYRLTDLAMISRDPMMVDRYVGSSVLMMYLVAGVRF